MQHTVPHMIRDLMQWIPLLPKEVGMIQMDISGHPPIPLAQNNCPLWQFPSYFSTVFRVLNFRGHFEALYDAWPHIQGAHLENNHPYDDYSPLGMSKKGSLFTSANVPRGDHLNTQFEI